MKSDNKYLQITKGASLKHREEFFKIKEPYIKAAWERNVKKYNEFILDQKEKRMSLVESYSYWRCPGCEIENKQRLTWKHVLKFKEIPDEEYSIEKCSNCGKEYYVNLSDPNPYCFKMNRGPCKNDYVKNLVIDANEKLTIVGEYYTT